MTETSQSSTVRLDITVETSRENAFRAFTEQFDKIKPREHNLLGAPIVESVLEPRVGGSLVDRAEDGTECRWGRVLVFDPPKRLVFTWDIGPDWQVVSDLDRASEVEVRFVAEGENRTRVELEHRHLERHGAAWESLRDGVAADGGWPLYLQRYADLLA